MDGWIKIYRAIQSHWIYENPLYLKWWIDLLITANYKDEKKTIGMAIHLIKRGQLVASNRFLQERWKYKDMNGKTCHPSPHTILKFMRLLELEKMILRDTNTLPKGATIITIVNYDDYQVDIDTPCNGVSNGISNAASNAPCNGVSNKDKKYKKERNINSSSDEELCVNPDEFTPIEEVEVEIVEPEIVNEEEQSWTKFFRQVKSLWDRYCPSYPKLIRLTDARKNKIKVRVKEMGGQAKALEIIETIFIKMESSPFLQGDNNRGWKASFDWVFQNDKNWMKIYEGNYDARQIQENGIRLNQIGNGYIQPTHGDRAIIDKARRDLEFAAHRAAKISGSLDGD